MISSASMSTKHRFHHSSISEDSGTVVSSVQAGAGSVNVLASQPAERLRVLLEVSNSLARAVEIGPLLPKILDGLFSGLSSG